MAKIPRSGRIYSKLRYQIVNRSIPPGTRLYESALCKKWDVSRTPIREGLRRLESEGLVTSHHHKGFVVNTITIEDIDQLYPIKISLEGLAGRFATPLISGDPKKLRALERSCRTMEALFGKGDIGGYIEKNNEFHSLIWNSCANKWLIRYLENLSSQVNRFIVKALYVSNRMRMSVREHWEIYRKIKEGNEKEVEKAIADHFKRASEDLKKELVKQI